MVRRLILILVLTVLGGLAHAQDAGRLDPETPAAAALGLRGAAPSVPSGNAPAPAPSAGGTPPPLLRPLAEGAAPLPPGDAAGRCRMACAEDYYFCLAGDAGDECPQAWSQCRLACAAG